MRDGDGIFFFLNPRTTDNVTSAPQLKATRDSVFSDLGYAAWKLHQKMFDSDTHEIRDDFKQLARHVETICEALSELGISIQDHTGKPFDSGQLLEVLAIQPTEGILVETVIETVRPTIYRDDRQILKGQVIVGAPTPLPKDEKKA
jgi:hypothetical protein